MGVGPRVGLNCSIAHRTWSRVLSKGKACRPFELAGVAGAIQKQVPAGAGTSSLGSSRRLLIKHHVHGGQRRPNGISNFRNSPFKLPLNGVELLASICAPRFQQIGPIAVLGVLSFSTERSPRMSIAPRIRSLMSGMSI